MHYAPFKAYAGLRMLAKAPNPCHEGGTLLSAADVTESNQTLDNSYDYNDIVVEHNTGYFRLDSPESVKRYLVSLAKGASPCGQ